MSVCKPFLLSLPLFHAFDQSDLYKTKINYCMLLRDHKRQKVYTGWKTYKSLEKACIGSEKTFLKYVFNWKHEKIMGKFLGAKE